jgi:hypothetical protein
MNIASLAISMALSIVREPFCAISTPVTIGRYIYCTTSLSVEGPKIAIEQFTFSARTKTNKHG